MKLSEIAEELAKLKSEPAPEPEPESELSDEAADAKIEFEKMIMEHPEVTDEMALGSMRETAEVEKGIDPATAAARERCRQLGIGDFDRNRPKKPPVAISETEIDPDEIWLKQILEKRRAKIAEQAQAQPRGADPAHRMPQRPQQQSWSRPRRHSLYAALDD